MVTARVRFGGFPRVRSSHPTRPSPADGARVPSVGDSGRRGVQGQGVRVWVTASPPPAEPAEMPPGRTWGQLLEPNPLPDDAPE